MNRSKKCNGDGYCFGISKHENKKLYQCRYNCELTKCISCCSCLPKYKLERGGQCYTCWFEDHPLVELD